MKIKITTLMGGSLEVDIDPNPEGLPFITLAHITGSQRHWIYLNKEQTEELTKTLQSMQAEL